MKLLYITNGITQAGGLERVLSVKASLLADDFGYEVHIISLNEAGKLPFFKFSDKLHFYSIKVSGSLFQYFFQYKNGIKKIVNEINPDVISVCDDGLKGFFLPQLIRSDAKWIHESHASFLLANKGLGINFRKKAEHYLKQILGNYFSRIIILTENQREEWRSSNILVIPNPASFSSDTKSFLKNKKIIAVGSDSYNKGYDLLLKIWEKIAEDFSDWELNIYGKNTTRNLQNISEKLNLKNINFHEPVSNIKNKYLESSVFLLPSRSEGFGMVILEAMSCGLPVISFDCPHGPKDIITDSEDGFLIKNGNIQEFAEKLKILMENYKLRQEMGNKGTENVKRYDAIKIMEIWDDLFKKLKSRKK